jgi:hypothetical protein
MEKYINYFVLLSNMESITLKVEKEFSSEIKMAMSPDYSTKTEFIREAIREKIQKIRRERALLNLVKFKGTVNGKSLTKEDKVKAAKELEDYPGDIFKDLGLK